MPSSSACICWVADDRLAARAESLRAAADREDGLYQRPLAIARGEEGNGPRSCVCALPCRRQVLLPRWAAAGMMLSAPTGRRMYERMIQLTVARTVR